MSNSILAAVRAAMHADPAEESPDEGEGGVPTGGRHDSQQEETSMSETDGKPAATTEAGIPKAEHDAAVTAARDEGHKAGAEAATGRFSAILSAEGISGDGKRMAAAFDLAVKSPGMSAEDVTGFVAGNVAAGGTPEGAADPESYEAARVAGAGLAAPAPAPKARGKSINRGEIFAARRHQGGKE